MVGCAVQVHTSAPLLVLPELPPTLLEEDAPTVLLDGAALLPDVVVLLLLFNMELEVAALLTELLLEVVVLVPAGSDDAPAEDDAREELRDVLVPAELPRDDDEAGVLEELAREDEVAPPEDELLELVLVEESVVVQFNKAAVRPITSRGRRMGLDWSGGRRLGQGMRAFCRRARNNASGLQQCA